MCLENGGDSGAACRQRFVRFLCIAGGGVAVIRRCSGGGLRAGCFFAGLCRSGRHGRRGRRGYGRRHGRRCGRRHGRRCGRCHGRGCGWCHGRGCGRRHGRGGAFRFGWRCVFRFVVFEDVFTGIDGFAGAQDVDDGGEGVLQGSIGFVLVFEDVLTGIHGLAGADDVDDGSENGRGLLCLGRGRVCCGIVGERCRCGNQAQAEGEQAGKVTVGHGVGRFGVSAGVMVVRKGFLRNRTVGKAAKSGIWRHDAGCRIDMVCWYNGVVCERFSDVFMGKKMLNAPCCRSLFRFTG